MYHISLTKLFPGITEYKQILEKSLKTEKEEHHQTKANFESKLNEEKNKCDSNSNQSKMKFNSLQQHYNLLQVSIKNAWKLCNELTVIILDRIWWLQRTVQ